jgi:glyoxylase-like metal-dependent hydrolase (beta-lactamase superfamily II)
MKSLHRPDLFCWSEFDEARNIDFNSFLWVRPGGNIMVDPLPLRPHDQEHLEVLGGVAWIVITNSDHIRGAAEIRDRWGAKIAGPFAESEHFPIACDRWLKDGDEVVPGLKVLALEGSKTPGELALLLGAGVLITGDLIRAHRGGSLILLPDAKLSDKAMAVASLRRIASLPDIEAVLVGDGWCIFRDGARRLTECLGQ